MNLEENVKKQIEARYKLVKSAENAYRIGFTPIEWKTNEMVISFLRENNLSEDLLEHVSYWVWTFRK